MEKRHFMYVSDMCPTENIPGPAVKGNEAWSNFVNQMWTDFPGISTMWIEFEKHGGVNVPGTNCVEFETEAQLIFFLLKWG